MDMNTASANRTAAWALVSSLALSCASAGAAVSAVGPGDFPGGSLFVDLAAAVDGTEVNGFSISGLTFSYSLGNGQVIFNGGPGITNNVAPPNVVSIGSPAGVLGISLPGLSSLFGYGYALLASGTVPDGTTITLFNGAANVGSLSYLAVPDPDFPGGFAGISSTVPFDRVELTFNGAVEAWAVDNFRVTAVPEPATVVMFTLGVAGLLLRQRQR
jgi:PEP-CTERM motif